MTLRKTFALGASLIVMAGLPPAAAAQEAVVPAAPAEVAPITLKDAIEVAMATNPEIIQAQMNTEAIQFEREQAQGRFAPTVDLEVTGGVRRLENQTRRTLGIADDWLEPVEIQLRGDWALIDGGQRRAGVLYQAARVDGASLRVTERSQFVALQVSRQYFDILLQERIVAAAQDNAAFHRSLVGDLATGVAQGSISIADQQQAEERLQAALVREAQAVEALENARISLRRLTGLDIDQVVLPPNLAASMPTGLADAVARARKDNPLVRESLADVDAANAAVDEAEGELSPTIGVEVVGRYGEDIDGFRGDTEDFRAQGYVRWRLFDGGIRRARVQEMVRRASQTRYELHDRVRIAEEDVRIAWNAMTTQRQIVDVLTRQSQVSDDLLLSYRSQFNIGRRSLLDVLDAQNTRFNTQVRLETARFSQNFAQYQVLAATNLLLSAMGVQPGVGAGMEERQRFDYGPPVPAELQRRRYAD